MIYIYIYIGYLGDNNRPTNHISLLLITEKSLHRGQSLRDTLSVLP